MTPDLQARLAEIEERERKASPAPWKHVEPSKFLMEADPDFDYSEQDRANDEFTVLIRNESPWLLSTVRQLLAENEELCQLKQDYQNLRMGIAHPLRDGFFTDEDLLTFVNGMADKLAESDHKDKLIEAADMAFATHSHSERFTKMRIAYTALREQGKDRT